MAADRASARSGSSPAHRETDLSCHLRGWPDLNAFNCHGAVSEADFVVGSRHSVPSGSCHTACQAVEIEGSGRGWAISADRRLVVPDRLQWPRDSVAREPETGGHQQCLGCSPDQLYGGGGRVAASPGANDLRSLPENRATLTLTVVDSRPTWQLVLEVAKQRRERKKTTLRMADLVADVQRIDPRRARSSIQPVIQEMTLNAGLGPTQPCGKVLTRVQHGWYQLLSDDE